MFRFEVGDDEKYETKLQSEKADEKQLNLFSCRGLRDCQQFWFPLSKTIMRNIRLFISPRTLPPELSWLKSQLWNYKRQEHCGGLGRWQGGRPDCYQLILSSNFWHEWQTLTHYIIPGFTIRKGTWYSFEMIKRNIRKTIFIWFLINSKLNNN